MNGVKCRCVFTSFSVLKKINSTYEINKNHDALCERLLL